MRKVTIYDIDGNAERVTLPAPFYTSDASGQEDYTGIWVTALYYGPRSGRCFVQTYSIWDDGHGSCQGYHTSESTLEELLRVADHVGASIPDGIPATVID